MGPKTVEKIETHGITSIERLADMTPEELTAIPGIGEKMVEKIQLSVAAYFQSLENQQAEGGEVTETEADSRPKRTWPPMSTWLRNPAPSVPNWVANLIPNFSPNLAPASRRHRSRDSRSPRGGAGGSDCR